MVLHDFLTTERDTILMAVKEMALATQGSRIVSRDLDDGGSLFYDELIGLMHRDQPFELHAEKGIHTLQSEKRGKEYRRLGYTISEVVSGYGNLCQAITQLATHRGNEITSREFRQLNLSLDTAIAEAVTEYAKARLVECSDLETRRLDHIASELSACQDIIAELLKMGESTTAESWNRMGGSLQQSLQAMVDYIECALVEVRSRSELESFDSNPTFVH
jgi:hypothetical protein